MIREAERGERQQRSDQANQLLDALRNRLAPYLKLTDQGEKRVEAFLDFVVNEYSGSFAWRPRQAPLFRDGPTAANVYTEIFHDIGIEDEKIRHVTKLDITFDRRLTPNSPEEQDEDSPAFSYGSIELGGRPVYLVLHLSLGPEGDVDVTWSEMD